jgi:hypothetical protein
VKKRTISRKGAKNRKGEILCLLGDSLRLCVSCFVLQAIFSHLLLAVIDTGKMPVLRRGLKVNG